MAVAGMSVREITALAKVFAACAGYIAASKEGRRGAAGGAGCEVSGVRGESRGGAEQGAALRDAAGSSGSDVLPPVIPLKFRRAVFAALYVAARSGNLTFNPFVAGNLKGGKPTPGPSKEGGGERMPAVGQSNGGNGEGTAEQCSALRGGPGPSGEGPGRWEICSAASPALGRVTG